MARDAGAKPIETMFHHLPPLRGYAARVILRGEELSDDDESDRVRRLAEFLTIGGSLNWTEKEVVSLLLREVFAGD